LTKTLNPEDELFSKIPLYDIGTKKTTAATIYEVITAVVTIYRYNYL
jgi:hypothetical protein